MSTINPLSNYSHKDHQQLLQAHVILLYMKGTPQEPLCGFSQLAVRILHQCNASFFTVDVLNPDIRSSLKQITKWPTFPQLYIQGQLIGGSDIIAELYASGELQKKLSVIA